MKERNDRKRARIIVPSRPCTRALYRLFSEAIGGGDTINPSEEIVINRIGGGGNLRGERRGKEKKERKEGKGKRRREKEKECE